jgi:hypothetical protein
MFLFLGVRLVRELQAAETYYHLYGKVKVKISLLQAMEAHRVSRG